MPHTNFPRLKVAHTPTPLELLENLGRTLGLTLYVKRDDCTGLGFGGNKVRQLEYYFGAAAAQKADTILITGAVQSNFVRTAAAMAAKFGMGCHIQLEERVAGVSELYRSNGNVLLDQLLGATLHSFPEGEDEAGADAAVGEIADELRASGKTPYVIPLAASHPPLGALGYIDAAKELAGQLAQGDLPSFDEIVVASGSAVTHSGLLFGLRMLGLSTPVLGICVRRGRDAQKPRVDQRLRDIAAMLEISSPTEPDDVRVFDGSLAPGYGLLNAATIEAIEMAAQLEGLFLDPVYTGKTMAGLMQQARSGELTGKRVLFWHTGGAPAIFAYGDQLVNSPDFADDTGANL